ncbi:MAG TPA: dihydrofolate reductase family protein [Chryseolinea sp.]
MRKFIVQQWITADSIVAEEDGGLSFVTVSAFAEPGDEDLGAASLEFIDTVDTMILGANTYAMGKGYWPTAVEQGEFGEKLNNLTKFVASSRLKAAPWGKFPAATITADPVATVRELKKQEGKDIWLWGSLTLMQSMFEAGVVDEVYLRVCPTTRGRGARMFEDRYDMRLLEAQAFESGVVMLRYGMKK